MLIGLKGYKNTGKDTVADYLVHRHDFTKIAFATKLKQAVAALFDIPLESVDLYKQNHGNTIDLVEVGLNIQKPEPLELPAEYIFTWHEFLQRFGTEMGREVFGEDFWVDQLINDLPIRKEWKTALSYNLVVDGNYVISDCRFENEAKRIRQLGGYVVEIIRPGFEPDGNSSEEPLPANLIDKQILNNDDLRTLYANTEVVLNELLRVSTVHK